MRSAGDPQRGGVAGIVAAFVAAAALLGPCHVAAQQSDQGSLFPLWGGGLAGDDVFADDVDAGAVRRKEPARPTLNSFGMTGGIDTPSALMQPDGQLSATFDTFDGTTRVTLGAQFLPWAEGAFRYSRLTNFTGGEDLYDRSLDLKIRLTPESRYWPAVGFGLQDFLGTGVYSAEYVVASKHLTPDIAVSLGLGWGRLASDGGFENPLTTISDRFRTRESFDGQGGEVNFGRFLQGENAAVFGSVSWRTPIEGLTLKAEYSSDGYVEEDARGIFEPEIPLNFGVEYRPLDGIELGGYYRYGEEFGLRVTLSGNPFRPPTPQDLESAPRQIRARKERSAGEMFGPIVTAAPTDIAQAQGVGAAILAADSAPARTHRVAAGETLYSIARRYSVPLDMLRAANGLPASNLIHEGQLLSIDEGGAPADAAALEGAHAHVVAPGETLYALSRRYGVSAPALAAANGLDGDARLEVGQRLRIPGAPRVVATSSLRWLDRLEMEGRWARARVDRAALSEAERCPVAAAQEIDGLYGPFGLVTFRAQTDGAAICSVVLRPDGHEIIAQTKRFDPTLRPVAYDTRWAENAETRAQLVEAIGMLLKADGLSLEAIDLQATRARLHVGNKTYRALPQAIGRAARVLARLLPPSVETFEIMPVEQALPLVRVVVKRTDLERLENRPDAADDLWRRATVASAPPASRDLLRGGGESYPRVSWSLLPDIRASLFDPDDPARGDVLARATASVEFTPGLSVSGSVSKRIFGQLDDIARESDSELPRVRSDFRLYAAEGDPGIDRLTADYVTKLTPELFARASVGYLEEFHGGVSGEVLWLPSNLPFALGIELNYSRQRDFDKLFGFQDYDVVTGHASAYVPLPFYDLEAQIDAGRYLAGDWGATFGLTRRFRSGWEIGGFFTLTDVPFDEFGEGSFDKGIKLTLPLDWFTPFPTTSKFNTTIRPLTRDGGQRLQVGNRLYPIVRDASREEIRKNWAEVWQ